MIHATACSGFLRVAQTLLPVCSSWEASALGTPTYRGATHGLFMSAFPTASGLLTITVKQAQEIFD